MLLKLTLLLPVATANVERVFSAMRLVKKKLRNSIGDELLNHFLVKINRVRGVHESK
jgi:hypothetical protein